MKFTLTLILTLSLILICSCSDDSNEPSGSISGSLYHNSGCTGSGGTGSGGTIQVEEYPRHLGAITYEYINGSNLLKLKHFNAEFNCCLTYSASVVESSGQKISITYKIETDPCDCVCLYNMETHVNNVARTKYTIDFVGLYNKQGEKVLLEIDLSQQTTGELVFERD
jgi:hypothetical protein